MIKILKSFFETAFMSISFYIFLIKVIGPYINLVSSTLTAFIKRFRGAEKLVPNRLSCDRMTFSIKNIVRKCMTVTKTMESKWSHVISSVHAYKEKLITCTYYGLTWMSRKQKLSKVGRCRPNPTFKDNFQSKFPLSSFLAIIINQPEWL